MVQLLVQKGADVSRSKGYYSYGGTALHSAATAGDKEIVAILLNSGGKNVLRTRDRYGLRPADCARENGHMEIEQMLLPEEEEEEDDDDDDDDYDYDDDEGEGEAYV
ncbi:uncharacterized protein F4817DRAFT_245825 [Daldinia loculata]|uniref:uncharacterized protein n=1 Tax=Daldinia loculata TaxID=103429 RepID=UPI0020C3A13C|nr:uncharacterized protein F4817DRAFT_245825 [Daldinia loculata]KAI1643748.1 hypothetical protein F4817DRAFT_245825 [Daldinia loculata]